MPEKLLDSPVPLSRREGFGGLLTVIFARNRHCRMRRVRTADHTAEATPASLRSHPRPYPQSMRSRPLRDASRSARFSRSCTTMTTASLHGADAGGPAPRESAAHRQGSLRARRLRTVSAGRLPLARLPQVSVRFFAPIPTSICQGPMI